MVQTQANIDFCGIRNLLAMLEKNGFDEKQIRKISARILAQIGADIIIADKKSAA